MVAISVACRFLLGSHSRFTSARDASNTIWSYCQMRSKKRSARTLTIAARKRKSKYFGEGSAPVDGAEQPVLEGVDGANKIGKCVRLVNQHRHATRRQTFPNAHHPWQTNRDLVAPAIAGKRDRLAVVGAIVAICDETVRDHRPAEKLDGGVLQPGGQRSQARSVRATGQNSTLRGREPARSSDRRKDGRDDDLVVGGTADTFETAKAAALFEATARSSE